MARLWLLHARSYSFCSSWGFEHDNIYIRYCTQVPSLWTVAPGSVLESSSQISRALVQQQPIGAEDSSSQHVWRWSLPFSFSIARSCATSHSSATLSDSPRIEVQVISYDSWDRARVLGMASISLSSASGVQEQVRCTSSCAHLHSDCVQVVQLWSPMGSVRDELAQVCSPLYFAFCIGLNIASSGVCRWRSKADAVDICAFRQR